MVLIIFIIVITILLIIIFGCIFYNKNTFIKILDENNNINKIGNIPIYYINLDKSKHRRSFMEAQFKNYNIKNYTRIPGIYGKLLNLKHGMLRDNFLYYNEKYMTHGELGCTLTHLIAIKKAYDNNDNEAIFMEDDASLSLMSHWKYSINELINKAPNNWEILNLYSYNINNIPTKIFKKYTNEWGCVFYLMSRKGMKKILDNCFDNNKIMIKKEFSSGLIDVLIYQLCNSYVISASLVYTNNNTDNMNSTIHVNHTNAHMGYSNNIIKFYKNIPKYHITNDGNKFHKILIETILPFFLDGNNKNIKRNDIITFANTNTLTQSDLDKFPYNIKILIDGEPHNIRSLKSIDLLLTTKLDISYLPPTVPTIYFPMWLMALSEYNISPLVLNIPQIFNKTKFCAFMYTNCDEKYEGVKYRNIFYDKLNEKLKVDSLGKCKNNNYIKNGSHYNSNIIFRDYKFVIAIENNFIDGYITEKLINPILAGCIPIYYGAKDVNNYFNKDRIINIRDYNTIEECIEYILKVNNDDNLFNNIIKQPALINYDFIDYEKYLYNKNITFK